MRPYMEVIRAVRKSILLAEEALRKKCVVGPIIVPNFHYNVELPRMRFVPNATLSVELSTARNMSDVQLAMAVYDCMASCALYREYIAQKEIHRTAIMPQYVEKPALAGYKSPKWWYFYKAIIKHTQSGVQGLPEGSIISI